MRVTRRRAYPFHRGPAFMAFTSNLPRALHGLLVAVALSTLATVIASQALISGAFSLTRQALMLGYLPRVRILHTSAWHIGQIYVPIVNWMLMCSAVALVLGFRTSSHLAAAYGVAVLIITA